MANLAWPNISPPVYGMEEAPEDAVIRSEMEAGYEQTRARFTRNRSTFTLKWSALSAADTAALLTFYKTTAGNGIALIDWTHPATSATHVVRFKEPPIVRYAGPGYSEVQVVLREV